MLAIIDKVTGVLSKKYKFGSYEADDIKQEGFIVALEGLEKYDESRPFENFMWVHIKNRLFNFKRDNFLRYKAPCQKCESANEDECDKFDLLDDCPKYHQWLQTQISKSNLLSPIGIEQICDEGESNFSQVSDFADVLDTQTMSLLIDEEMPVLLRSHYLQMKDGMNIAKTCKARVVEAIKSILVEHGYLESEDE